MFATLSLRVICSLVLAGALLLGPISPAHAAQGSGCMPTTGTVSGLTFSQNVNAGIAALISSNSGASAPATDCTAVAVKGQVWLDTSVIPNMLQQYDGTAWVLLGALDATNHLWAPPIGGGSATIASVAGTTDIWANPAASITISGTNAITALANADAVPGTVKVVTASGIFSLTNGAALELPTGANITAAVGDRFLVIAKTPTNVAVFAYTRADGSAVTNPSVPLGTVLYGDYGTIPPKSVYGFGQALSRASYPGYLAAVTRAQTGTLTAGNSTITSVGNTAGLGLGMPLEGTGIQAGATISSVTASTIVMSATATANGAQTVTAFLTGYGSGGDSTTVGVRDCRGRVMAGRDNMGGTAASRLTSSAMTPSGNVIGATPSAESQLRTLLAANLPPYTPTGTVATAPSLGGNGNPLSVFNSGGTNGFTTSSANASGTLFGAGGISLSSSFTGTAAPGQISTPLSIMQPTGVAECVVAVLP